MSNAFKLLVGTTPHILDVVEEQANAGEPKKLYIEGIFGEAGKKNKNGRVYDPEEMMQDIVRYNEEFVKTKRAYNELNHPSTPDVDLERACDMTTSLRMESDGTIIGKALVLDTPMGKIQRALIDGGGVVGKSSRAMGQISEATANDGSRCDYVKGVHLVCFDSVQDPSVGRAIPDALLEQREWLIGEDGGYIAKPLDDLEKSLSKLPRLDRDMYIAECVAKFIQSIKA